jgi:hypothetical protein
VEDSRREDFALRGKHLNYLLLRRAGAEKSFNVLPETVKYTYFSTKIVPPSDTILHLKIARSSLLTKSKLIYQVTNRLIHTIHSFLITTPFQQEIFRQMAMVLRDWKPLTASDIL